MSDPAEGWEMVMQDGVFIKQMIIHPGQEAIQETHKYDHSTLLTLGRMAVWQDDEFWGEFLAPHILTIKAGVKHRFQALTTVVAYCIHNVSRTGEVEVIIEALAE